VNRLWLWLALALVCTAESARAELPPEDECPTVSGRLGALDKIDASPTLIREGMILGADDVLALRDLLPAEVWSNRDQFFHEGMRLQIGPCHRRYPTADFYTEATRKFAGTARLDDRGNLLEYEAGVPFPQGSIDPQSPDAGIRWAWNHQYRYRGAGPVGRFRIVDLPGPVGAAQTYLGWFFFVQTAHRADLEESGYSVPVADSSLFAAGGRFDAPFSARHLAWTQRRPLEADAKFSESDDTFVYVPTMRKIRRAATTSVDGMFTPRYRVAGDSGGGGIGGIQSGGSGYDAYGGSGGIGALNPTSAASAAQTEAIARGFTELAFRPNAYRWRVRGEREVLAPLNASRDGYPRVKERNFGPSGLSVGSDRWDVRYAVVIEGATLERGGEFEQLLLYIDYQTLQPLYLVTRLRNGRIVEITIPVHRYSGDVFGYLKWPDGSPARVFDPVAVVAFTALDGSGWRREGYDVTSVPLTDEQVQRYTSSAYLTRGK
jgi:hypothetical protein